MDQSQPKKDGYHNRRHYENRGGPRNHFHRRHPNAELNVGENRYNDHGSVSNEACASSEFDNPPQYKPHQKEWKPHKTGNEKYAVRSIQRNRGYTTKSKDSSMLEANTNEYFEENSTTANLNQIDNPDGSRRGNIVGGRYIRKHTNHVSQEAAYANEVNEPVTSCDRNTEFNSNTYRNREYFSGSHRQHNGNFSSATHRKKNSNFSDIHPKHNFSSDAHQQQNRNFHSSRQHQNNFTSSGQQKHNFSDVRRQQNFSRTQYQKTNYPSSSNEEKYSYDNSNKGQNDFEKSKTDNQQASDNDSTISDDCRYTSQNVSRERVFHRNAVSKDSHRNRLSEMSSYRESEATQRERLIQQLNKGDCECLVCCEQIRVKDHTWHCLSCYHVFHLRCIKKWARSPAAIVEDSGWRCPACQNLTSKVPYDYFCFCGKSKYPDVNYHLTPHSCGEICERSRPECSHACKELCHPGPCPPCLVNVQKSCACGKTVKRTTCKQNAEETCSSVCEKTLNCGKHSCDLICHSGPCPQCEETISQTCCCSKSSQTVTCTSDTADVFHFSCNEVCGQTLGCGNHTCERLCHPGVCSPCNLSVESVKFCPCGKTSLEKLSLSNPEAKRKSCKDPVPLCTEKCEKNLTCGPKDNPHKCESSCHHGDCTNCPLTTSLKCCCGAFTKEISCADITPSFVYQCEKRCNRRKDCGRHKCFNNCCTNSEHHCQLVCNKKLSCGNHSCQEICHLGNCGTCWNVSFDELRCHCGESVLYPPIHCGTKPPECTKPCIRTHPCDHEVKHTCHNDETCPPCTSFTVKWCYGHHKKCATVMCFLDGVSCGMQCLKDLSCGNHKCNLTCHSGPCLKGDAKCTQLCPKPRLSCGHLCGNPCHEGPCIETPCKTQVKLTCPCGHRSETKTCHESTKSYRLMSQSILASRMQDIKEGQSVNLNEIMGKKAKNSKLQCNEECAVIERNKRLAVALQIQNPELSASPGPPSYSEFLKTEARKNPDYVANIYEKISDLVKLAKESKHKCRSFSFPPMNRDHRRIVHELAEFFGCETQSYDEEPKKNVVVTAQKNKCWLPFVDIMTVVQRDMGFRKGPIPVLMRESKNNTEKPASASTSQKKKIDYFDYNE